MPQVTVFIRNEDIDKWRAVEKKSEWMHQWLNAPYMQPPTVSFPIRPINPEEPPIHADDTFRQAESIPQPQVNPAQRMGNLSRREREYDDTN